MLTKRFIGGSFFGRQAEPVLTPEPLSRQAESALTHHHQVRFEINFDNNNDKQQHNDDIGAWNNDVGFGMCKSSYVSSEVEISINRNNNSNHEDDSDDE